MISNDGFDQRTATFRCFQGLFCRLLEAELPATNFEKCTCLSSHRIIVSFSCARAVICPFHSSSSTFPIPSSSFFFFSLLHLYFTLPESQFPISLPITDSPRIWGPLYSSSPHETHTYPQTHTHTQAHRSTDSFIHAHTNTNLSASSLYPPSPSLSQMCTIPWENSTPPPAPENNKKKNLAAVLSSPFQRRGRRADECGGADVDERRAIKILSALFFPSDPEGKLGDRDCVWHGEKKKTSTKNLSNLNQRNLFWRPNKDKRTTGFMGPLTCRIKDI